MHFCRPLPTCILVYLDFPVGLFYCFNIVGNCYLILIFFFFMFSEKLDGYTLDPLYVLTQAEGNFSACFSSFRRYNFQFIALFHFVRNSKVWR